MVPSDFLQELLGHYALLEWLNITVKILFVNAFIFVAKDR